VLKFKLCHLMPPPHKGFLNTLLCWNQRDQSYADYDKHSRAD